MQRLYPRDIIIWCLTQVALLWLVVGLSSCSQRHFGLTIDNAPWKSKINTGFQDPLHFGEFGPGEVWLDLCCCVWPVYSGCSLPIPVPRHTKPVSELPQNAVWRAELWSVEDHVGNKCLHFNTVSLGFSVCNNYTQQLVYNSGVFFLRTICLDTVSYRFWYELDGEQA